MRAAVLALAVAGPAWAAPHVTPDEPLAQDVHIRLDTDVAFGLSRWIFVGAQVHLLTQLPVWHGAASTGSFDVSARLAYHQEPGAFAFWFDPDDVQGANHRGQVQVGVGHTFHVAPRRQVAVGLHVLAGWNVFVEDWRVTYTEEDFEAAAVRVHHDPLVTGEATVAWRITEWFGLNLALGGALPTAGAWKVTQAHAALGASWYLR